MISDCNDLLNTAIFDENREYFIEAIKQEASLDASNRRNKGTTSSLHFKSMIDFVNTFDKYGISREITAELLKWNLWDVQPKLPQLLATYSETKLKEIIKMGRNNFLNISYRPI